MRNRVISLFVAIIIVLLCFSCPVMAAAANNDLAEDYIHKLEVLNALKITNLRKGEAYIGGDLGDYGLFRDVSKSEFINYICNMYGEYGFTDGYSEEAISIAEGLGIIHSNQTDLNKSLYYEEALTMLVRALNYETLAQQSGGYPAGYIAVASSLGLMNGVSAGLGEPLKDHDAVQLLYNSLDCDYAKMIGYTASEGASYSNASKVTLLYEYRRIYKIEGIVEATEYAELRRQTRTLSGEVMIDGYIYGADGDLSRYIGMNVEAYVKEQKSDNDVIYSIFPFDNEELVIGSDDILEVSDDFRKITYYDEASREKKASLSNIAKIIYNGQVLAEYTAAGFMPANGMLRLIENGGNSGYDVVFITDYKTVVVDNISKLNQTVKNKYSYDISAETIDLSDDNEEDMIKITYGETTLTPDDITKDDVLLVAQSQLDDRRVIDILVSREKIYGAISEINTDNEIVITVNGKEYELSPAYKDALSANDAYAEKLKLGNTYTFLLDVNGEIAFAKEGEDFAEYAIVMGKAEESGLKKSYSLKLYTPTGEIKILNIADKLELDGVRSKKASEAYGVIETGMDGVVNVIAYRVNSDGEINFIDTAEEYNAGNDGRFNVKVSGGTYRTGDTAFDSNIFVEDTPLMWMVDKNNLDEDESYTRFIRGGLIGDTPYTFNAYNVDEYGFAGILVMMSDEALTQNSVIQSGLFVVDRVGDGLTSDGEILGKISGVQGTYENISYYYSSDCKFDANGDGVYDDVSPKTLKQGDIISVAGNSSGLVSRIIRYHSLSDDVYKMPPVYGRGDIFKGAVHKIDVDKMRMVVDCGTATRAVRLVSQPVIIYDMSDEALSVGNLNDIEEGDIVVGKLIWARLSGIVIYKK